MSRSSPEPQHDQAASYSGRGARHGLGDPESLSPTMRGRRAVTLLLLTLVVPGSAQLTAGSRRLGRAGVRVWLCLLIGAALYGLLFLVNRSAAIGLVARSWFLFLVIVALVVGALFWAVLFVDAWRLGHIRLTPPGIRRLASGLTVVLVLLTSGSMLYAARQVWTGRELIATVFGGHEAKETSGGRYNVLLLGGDSGADRVGTRPDSINLVSIDADTGRTAMFGFARDTENINFREGSLMRRLMPRGWNCGDDCLLNGLYQWAQENKAKFPADVKDPGVEATREAVEALSGIDIQYYVLVDLKGFQRLVNAVGGLTINVKAKTPIGGGTSRISGYIMPGVQHLDGYHALWYARSRTGATNYDRMARQRCVMTAMLQQLNPQTVLFKFQELASASGSIVKTDLPDTQLGDFVDLAIKAKSQKVTSVNFVPPLIKPWDYDPDVVTGTVRKTIAATEAEPTPKAAASTSKASTSQTSGSTAVTPTPGRSASAASAAESDLTAVCSAA